MFKNNDKIASGQMAYIFMLMIIEVSILTQPRELTENLGPDGLFVLLVAGLIALVFAYVVGYIVKSFPGKSYIEILTICFTKPVAYIITFLFIVHVLVVNGFLVRIFGEVIKMFLLIRTPIEVIIFSLLLIAAYAARNGIEAIGRLAELLFPLIMIPALILFGLVAVDADFSNLLPVFQASPIELVKAVPPSFFTFGGFEFILVFGVFLKDPKKAPKLMTIGIGVVLFVYIFIFGVTVAGFGTDQLAHMIWPTMSIFKTIDFPGLFIENVEGLVMVIWIFLVFMSTAVILLVKTILVGNLLRLRERDFFALPLVPIIYLIALFPQSLAETYEYMGPFSTYSVTFFAFIIPLFIAISLGIRKIRGRESGSRV